jgi:uncharacterized protein
MVRGGHCPSGHWKEASMCVSLLTMRLAGRLAWRSACSGVVLVLALLPAFAACGTAQRSVPAAGATPTPSPSATPVVTVQTVNFTTQDGVTLAGALYGQGTHAVILSNEGNNASAPWQPVAEQLGANGYLVLSYAYRPTDANYDGLAAHALTDLRAAIAFLRARPITQLVLVGASLGALVSLKVATTQRCDALVAISSPLGYQDVQLTDDEMHHLVVPKLFVTSVDNPPFTSDTLHLFAMSAQPKEKEVYPGEAHGTDLFGGASGADLMRVLLRFVQRYAPVR